MKKIILSLIIIFAIIVSCKKTETNYCYNCHVNMNGNDTIICDKSKAQLDDLYPEIQNCIKNN